LNYVLLREVQAAEEGVAAGCDRTLSNASFCPDQKKVERNPFF
jgi:hypothetical protein